ncbi:MAG TPA: DUF885 domain-containing protein [Usitatibacter sp.]|nr:DUF885 domain-containing protein [Usitatibacter sp.]
MRTMCRFITCLILLAAPLAALSQSPSARLHALAEEMVEREFDLVPAREAYAQGAGPRSARALRDLAPGFRQRTGDMYRGILERLAAIPRSELAEEDRINYDLLKRRAHVAIARSEFPLAEIALLNPGNGLLPLMIGVMTGAQPFRNTADYENWLARVEASAAMFEHAVPALRSAARQGWTAPRALVEKGMRQLEAVGAVPAEEGPFWGVMARYPRAIAADVRLSYESSYRAALGRKLLPAIRKLAAFAREEYLPMTREAAGVGALPGGDRAYRALVREYTTLELSPEDIHALGLAEVSRIRVKMLEVARSLGFKGEIKDLVAWYEANRANYPFQTADDVLAHLRRVHAKVEPQLPRLFKRLPRAPFEIQRTDPAIAASASATYSRPLADGSRPGVFRIPVVDPQRIAAFGLTALLLHEGMPGHHMDIGLGVERAEPRFRKVDSLTVFSEGWGLYAESLGHELGVYDDPWALLGRYSAEIHRAARLVVDTGMHARGWSRERAIRYLVEERGHTPSGAIVAVERYMGSPGQALAYKMGELEILKLRAEARAALGERFDLRDFHEVVLGQGQVTLPMLGERVRAWIGSQKRAR